MPIATSSNAPTSHRHSVSIALVAVTVVLAIAACGSSSSEHNRSSSPAGSPIALSNCMRSHGVPNFPDPAMGAGGEGFPGGISQSVSGGPTTVGGVTFSGPAFQSAVKTCKMFGGGSEPPGISESQKLGMIANARCLRQHGVDVPDPTFPASGGVQSSFGPGENPYSPAVEHAAKACAHVGTTIPGIGGG